MKIIVISRPDFFFEEAAAINQLFAEGLKFFHLRKPDCKKEDLRELLKCIEPVHYSQIALHQHHDLADEFGITRLHFTENHRRLTTEELWKCLKTNGYQLSTSIHELGQLADLSDAFSYTFFGPVFDSISKDGHAGVIGEGFTLNKERKRPEVIALGGIDASNIQKIKKMNFDGAALLGAIWQSFSLSSGGLSPRQLTALGLCPQPFAAISPGPKQFIATGQSPKKSIAGDFSPRTQIERMQFVSQENGEIAHIESISIALEAGCKWIQLRVKRQPEAEVLRLAEEAKSLCDKFNAKLIINDFPFVAKKVRAHGLHLGLNDMPLREARKIVGDEMIIGGTANTLDHVVQRIEEGADYVGLGPFRFTETKQNLSPILSLEGYQRILNELKNRQLSIPIVAIGGIRREDIAGLLATGLQGVAMSTALINSKNRRETVLEIERSIC